jgi:DME family drug/metabolite transporter
LKNSGYLLVILAAILWGTTGTTQALAPSGATPQALSVLRLLGGGLTLVTIATLRGTLHQNLRLPPFKTALAVLMITAYQLLFFAGVGRAGVAIGTIVGIGSAPIIAGLLKVFVEKQPITPRWMIATVFALVGCGLLLLPDGEIDVDAFGILLAVGAGLAYAVYTLTSKYLLDGRDSDAVMAIVFSLGAILLSPILLTVDFTWLTQPSGWIVFVWLGIIVTGVSYLSFGRGLKTVPAATAVTLTLAEPLTAGLLGVLLIGEDLGLLGILGILLLFIGLAILTTAPQEASPAN